MTQLYGTPYFVAPEVVNGCYTQKCDVWSVGVILHVLLVGRPPFDDRDPKKLLAKISSANQISFEDKAWKARPIGAIDLLKKMINCKVSQRASAEEAVEHWWLLNMGQYSVTKKQIRQCLDNFSTFRYIGMLQKAILAYFVTNVFTENDNDYYRKIFLTINKSANGMLTRSEFLAAYWGAGLRSLSEIEVDRVLAYIDTD